MKKVAILAMSLLIAGAVFAQTPEKATKKEATKTEKACCKKDGKACAEKKDGKACAEKKACCKDKKADAKKK